MIDDVHEAIEVLDALARVVPVPMIRINRAILTAIFARTHRGDAEGAEKTTDLNHGEIPEDEK